jgi:hypothetical protein
LNNCLVSQHFYCISPLLYLVEIRFDFKIFILFYDPLRWLKSLDKKVYLVTSWQLVQSKSEVFVRHIQIWLLRIETQKLENLTKWEVAKLTWSYFFTFDIVFLCMNFLLLNMYGVSWYVFTIYSVSPLLFNLLQGTSMFPWE